MKTKWMLITVKLKFPKILTNDWTLGGNENLLHKIYNLHSNSAIIGNELVERFVNKYVQFNLQRFWRIHYITQVVYPIIL